MRRQCLAAEPFTPGGSHACLRVRSAVGNPGFGALGSAWASRGMLSSFPEDDGAHRPYPSKTTGMTAALDAIAPWSRPRPTACTLSIFTPPPSQKLPPFRPPSHDCESWLCWTMEAGKRKVSLGTRFILRRS